MEEKKKMSSIKKYSIVSKLVVAAVVVFLFLVSFVVLGFRFDTIKTSRFWATFTLLLLSSEVIYKSIIYVNKEKLKEEDRSYVESNTTYNDLVNQFNTNYARKTIDEWAKEVNVREKLNAYRTYLEEDGLCLDDLKLTKKQLKLKYNNKDQEQKLDKHQLKTWKKCKYNRMPYEKLNTSILLYDRANSGKTNDKFGTDEASRKNDKKRSITFTFSKIFSSIVVVLIGVDTLKDFNIESIVRFCIYMLAIASAYATALINSSLYIKDRIVEFSKRIATLLDFFRSAKDNNYEKFNIYNYLGMYKEDEEVEELDSKTLNIIADEVRIFYSDDQTDPTMMDSVALTHGIEFTTITEDLGRGNVVLTELGAASLGYYASVYNNVKVQITWVDNQA